MPQSFTAIALDLGTHTGWARSVGDRIVASGVRDFSLKQNEHKGKRGIRFYNFLLTLGQPDVIFYEVVQFTGSRPGGKVWAGDNGELYKGLLMLVNMFGAGFGVPTIGVHPSSLKKQFSGNGKAEKIEMCDTARKYGWLGGSPGTDLHHDEADAGALIITQLRSLYGIDVRWDIA